MKIASIDHIRSRSNPWGLTPHQCCAMRLVCKHGNAKQVWAATDTPIKTTQSHIEEIRKKMGSRGHDVRIYIEWDRWLRAVVDQPRKEKKFTTENPDAVY